MSAASSEPSRGAALVFTVALALVVGACAGGNEGNEDGTDTETSADSETAGEVGGRVSFAFEATSTVTINPNLVDELIGSVYGNMFLAADVSVTGPRDDAERFGAVEVDTLDLRELSPSDLLWTSEELPPGDYVFLGYFDVDGSSAALEEKDPETGDPVTLATVNKFTITAGETTELVVRFDLVLP